MKAMIYRNLILCKKMIWLVPVYSLVYMAIFKVPVSVLSTSLFVGVYLFVATLFAYEDQAKATVFNKALPVKTSTIVSSYYICLVCVLAYSLIWSMLIHTLMTFIRPGLVPATMQDVLIAVATALVMAAVQLPVIIKFGTIKTRLVNLLILMGLFALMGIFGAALGVDQMTGTPLFALGVLVTAFLVLLLSYVISTSIYAKKESD